MAASSTRTYGSTTLDSQEQGGALDTRVADGPTFQVYTLVSIACLNGINLGYDIGATGGAALLMQEELKWTETQTEVFVGCINIIALFGGLVAGCVCDALGRRLSLTLSAFVFIAGVLLTVAAASFSTAMFGRVFVGIGVGFGLAVGPLYVSEISPPQHRGRLVAFQEIAINFGIMIGFVADYVLYDILPAGLNWRAMLGAGLLLPVILIFLTTFVMLESPRWFVMQGRKQEALDVLTSINPPGTDVDSLVKEIEANMRREAAYEKEGVSLWAPPPAVKMMMLAGIGLAVVQQINGSESFIYFSPELFAKAGISSREKEFGMTVLVGVAKTSFILVGALYADSVGRRPLLLCSTLGMATCLLGCAVANYLGTVLLQLTCMCVFMAFFSVGVGPVTWVGSSEVFPTYLRARALALATAANRFTSGMVAMTTLSLSGLLGMSGYFMFYAFLTLCSAYYIWVFFPETKGKTLEQVNAYFEAAAKSCT